MPKEPYEVASSGYGDYRKRSDSDAASSETAATTAFGIPAGASQAGYVVGGAGPLETAPREESWTDPVETRRRKLLLIALAVAAVVAVAVLAVGHVVFDTGGPEENRGEQLPPLPEGVSAPLDP